MPFLANIRYALRQLRNAPVFSLTALLTLALGIGATTAIFTLIDQVMLRSLPVADPASLYRIGGNQYCCVDGGIQGDWDLFSYALYQRLRAATPEFEQEAAFQASPVQFSMRRQSTGAPAKPLRGEFVSGNYFSMFGVGAFAGRVLSPADDAPGAAPAAMLSYRAWQQDYGADPSVVGAVFAVEGQPFTIVGVAPPGFYGETLQSHPPDVWLPLQLEPLVRGSSSLLNHTSTNWLRIIGRLRPGATTAGMDARLTAVLRQWIPESGLPAEFLPQIVPELNKQHVRVVPGGGGVGAMRADYGANLEMLLTICGLVLLMACANIANLLLARGTGRRQQTAVQVALGASRPRLVRQALTESVVLAVLGGAAGLTVAYGGTRLMLLLAFRNARFVPISASPSLPVLGFALGLSVLTGVLFGTAPAWLATHADPAEALRGANRSSRDRASLPQKTLVVMQAMLSVVLLASAGMLAHSLRNLEHRDLGFPTENRIVVQMNAPPASYSAERLQALDRALEERLGQIPGVERVGLALYTPFTDSWSNGIVLEGHAAPADDPGTPGIVWDRVSAGYFAALGQPLVRGRSIEEQDTGSSRRVAVVSEAFARRYLHGEDPLGKHFGIDLPSYASSYEIVGVVRDAHYEDPRQAMRPMFFLPLKQSMQYREEAMQLGEVRSQFITGAVLLTHSDLGRLEPQIRRAFAEVDPNLTIISIDTLAGQAAMNFDQQRAVAQLAGLFGGLALVLAAVGLYGVTAYTVARRTNEIGIRMALGADRMNVVRLVLRGAFRQVVLGLALGIPAAVLAGRLMSAQLYGVRSWDPAPLGVAIFLLGICALAASVLPAQRAASIDPVRALRME